MVEDNENPSDMLMTAILFRDHELLKMVLNSNDANQHLLGHCLILPLLHTKDANLLRVAIRYPDVVSYLEDALDDYRDLLFDILLLDDPHLYQWTFKNSSLAKKNVSYVKKRDLVDLYASGDYSSSQQHTIHNLVQTL